MNYKYLTPNRPVQEKEKTTMYNVALRACDIRFRHSHYTSYLIENQEGGDGMITCRKCGSADLFIPKSSSMLRKQAYTAATVERGKSGLDWFKGL